jgi:uncharacterized protein
MGLKDRLNRLTGEPAKPFQTDHSQDKISELRAKIDKIMNRRERIASQQFPKVQRSAIPLEHAVAGEETRTQYGNFFVSRRTFNGNDVHGHARICDFACLNMEATAFLARPRMSKDITLEDGLFLDTETTGLAGGTGTFPFLIGLGWFETGSFITCQLFARDFSEERAVLRYLSELAADKQFLVTFNGRAYDMNLLAARFILNRSHDTLTTKPHIDLLHPSRRIFAHRLDNARLSAIETQVLGVRRDGDVPGFEIPQRYFDWLRIRDGKLMEDVFTHNRMDIVSMASLLKHLADLAEDCQEVGQGHHDDFLKMAGLLYERGNPEKAERMLELLLTSHKPDVVMSARRSLSLIYKKAHRWEDATRLWQDLLAANPKDVFAGEELAKFFEHHAREFRKALEIVSKLLDDSIHLSDDERVSLEHRLQRLHKHI